MTATLSDITTVRDLRRAQIVAAARRVVADQGLEALTFGSLEKALPFTRGVITHHFADKDEIVAAVLRDAVAEIDEATRTGVEAGVTLYDKVHAVLRTKVRGFLDHPDATRVIIAFWGRLHVDPAAREHNAALYARYRRQAANLLADAVAAGVARPDVDPAVVGTLLVGLVIGIVGQAMFEPGAVDVDRSVDEAARVVHDRIAAR